MLRLLFCLLLFPALPGLSQNFIGKTRAHVKKELEKQLVKNDTLVITLKDNDSTLVYSYKDARTQAVDFIYGFDKQQKCRSEKVLAGCDSCFRKYLQQVLLQKKFDWKKINENQYVSKYSEHMLLEIPINNKDFSYTILRTEWTKEVYNMLLGN